MRNILEAVLIVASMQAGFAQAIQMASSSSNKMVKTCLVQEQVADGICQAFVLGVVDATAFYGAAKQMTPQFCIPRETAAAEIVSVYRDYLKENHALNQFSAAALAISAFKKAYPCE